MRRGCWALLALAGCTFGQSDLADSVASVGATDSPMMGTTAADDDTTGTTTADPSTSGTNLPGGTDDDGKITATDGTTSDADGTTTMMEESSSSSGGEESPLVSDGLLVRYFLDDYPAGVPPEGAVVADAGPGIPLDLPIIVSQNQPIFSIAGGHSGLSWDAVNNDGRPIADVVDTKIMDLDGGTQVTLEFVADVNDVNGMGTRFIHIGSGTNGHALAVSSDDLNSIHLRTHVSNETAVWAAELDAGRSVYTIVVDLDQVGGDRYRLFVNGTETAATSFMDVVTLQISASHALSLGNRSAGDRSIDGTLFYAAIYDRALSPDEVQQNADALGDSDDSP